MTKDARAALAARVRERDFQQLVLQAAAFYGWLAYHTYDSRRSQPGFPDLVLCHPSGDFLLAELKSERGRVRPEQHRWLAALSASQIEWHVWRPSQIDSILVRLARTT